MNCKTFLARAVSHFQSHPFVSKDSALIHVRKPSYQLILDSLDSSPVTTGERNRTRAHVNSILQWVENNKKSTFMGKIRAIIADCDNFNESKAAMLTAIIPAHHAWAKLEEKNAAIAKRSPKANWVGNKGDAFAGVVEVLGIDIHKFYYQTKKTEYKITCIDENGHLIIYHTMRPVKFKLYSTIRIKGTIKTHGKYGDWIYTGLGNTLRMKL